MKEENVIGIDIGTKNIKIIISDYQEQNNKPKILYHMSSPSHGFRYGYVNDEILAVHALQKAIRKMEKIYKQKITNAHFSISGAGLKSKIIRSSFPLNKENPIKEEDIDSLLSKSERLFSQKYPNQKILHLIPIHFFVNEEQILGNPIGMYGENISAKIIFVTIQEHHYDIFLSVITQAGLSANSIIAAPLADSYITANYEQKQQGCSIINIGSEISSFSTFYEGNLTSLKIEKIGSNNITNDIALGLQTSLIEAENIKLLKNKNYPRKKIDEIIYARIYDFFEIIEKYIFDTQKNKLFPAGIIFSGGGAKVESLDSYAKKVLKLPIAIAKVEKISKKTKRSTNIGSEYTTAYGLCFQQENTFSGNKKLKKIFNLKNIKKKISFLLNEIMP